MSKGRKKFLVISVISIVLLLTAALTISYCRTGKIGLDGVVHFSAESWKCEFNSKFNSVSGHSSNDLSYFKCDDLVVVELGNQPLIKLVAKQMVDELIKTKTFKNVRYIDAGQPDAERIFPAPDFVLTIDLNNVTRSEVSGGVELTGLVGVEFGRRPLSSTVMIHGRVSHINIAYNMSGSLNFTAKCKGYGPEGSEYDLLSKNISSTLSKSIDDSIKKLKEKHPPMPQLPAVFSGTGKNVSDPAVMQKIAATSLFKTAGGFLRHSESYWLLEGKGDTAAFLGKVYDTLIDAGYKRRVRRPGKKEFLRDRAWFFNKDGQVAELFEIRETISTRMPGPKVERAKRYGIRFTHSFNENELKAAIASMVKAEPDKSIFKLLPFTQILTDDQKQKLLDQMQADKNLPVDQLVQAARFAYMLKKKDQARQHLRKAKCSLGIMGVDAVHKLASEFKDEEVLKKPITADELASYGFYDLSEWERRKKLEFAASKVYRFFVKGKDRAIRTVTFEISQDAKEFSFCHRGTQINKAGKLTTSWKVRPKPIVDPKQTFRTTINDSDYQKLFDVTIKPSDKPGTFVCQVVRTK